MEPLLPSADTGYIVLGEFYGQLFVQLLVVRCADVSPRRVFNLHILEIHLKIGDQ